MSNVIPFEFKQNEVRVVAGQDGEPWFVAKDVAEILGYRRTADAIRAHCKGVGETQTPINGVMQSVKIIPERDVYRLIMRSKMPEAEAFEEWVVGKVLPSIRKTGGYQQPPGIPQTLPEALRLAAELAEEKAKAQAEVAELAPKARALEVIAASPDALTLTQTAKVLGVKLVDLTHKMHAEGWIYRQNSSWVAYDQHIKNGNLRYKEAHYTDEKTGQPCIKPYCHVTQKGLTRLAERICS